MSLMIYLLSLLFISLIPISNTALSQLSFLFHDGFNVIRCGDNQVQVYNVTGDFDASLDGIVQCNNKDEILSSHYSVFEWDHLTIVCTSSFGEVHEEHYIHRVFLGSEDGRMLPNPKGLEGQTKMPFELRVVSANGGEYMTFKTDDQPANKDFYTAPLNMKRSYIQFPGYPVICRIFYFGKKEDVCSDETDVDIDDAAHLCYYKPGADVEPTPDELEAELDQVFKARTGTEKETYVLNLKRPVISSDKLPDLAGKIKPDSPADINPGKRQKKMNEAAPNSPKKNQKKSRVVKIIVIVLGVLLLLALVGAVGFYLLQKNPSNQPSTRRSPSAARIEAGNNNNSAVFGSKQSEASSAADDSNNEISMNGRLVK